LGVSTVNVLGENVAVSGYIAGFASTPSRLYVSMDGAGSTGGIVVFDVECTWLAKASQSGDAKAMSTTTTMTVPTPEPTEAPSPAPTEGTALDYR